MDGSVLRTTGSLIPRKVELGESAVEAVGGADVVVVGGSSLSLRLDSCSLAFEVISRVRLLKVAVISRVRLLKFKVKSRVKLLEFKV